MYHIKISSQFKKDLKNIRHKIKLLEELKKVIHSLALGEKLDDRYLDHPLKGIYVWKRECHIKPDYLLIYEIDGNDFILLLLRAGSHSDLFL